MAERLILFLDADREDCGVQEAEDDSQVPESEHEREDCDLTRHDDIVRVIDPAIWSAFDQRLAGQDNDARRPAVAEGRESQPKRRFVGSKLMISSNRV